MSVWDEIDALKRRFQDELARTESALDKLGDGKALFRRLHTDDLGLWRCSFYPTWGNRQVQRLSARSGDALVTKAKEALAKRPAPKGAVAP